MTDTAKTTLDAKDVEEQVKEMLEAGVFYGRKKSRTHPRMKARVLHNRNGIEIINLHKTAEDIQEAMALLQQKAKEGALMLMVGTQPAFEDLVAETAKELEISVVLRRWLGGTLTNFSIISKRIDYYKKLKVDLASGALEKYTKKERLDLEREMNRLRELVGGMEQMPRVPDVLIIIDANLHMAAVREARQLQIPIVALVNIDTDPDLIKYPVVGNNKSRQSVGWFLEKVKLAVKEGKKHASVAASAAAAEAAAKTAALVATAAQSTPQE